MKKIREYIKEPDFKMTIKNNKINIENYIKIIDITDTKIEILNDNKKLKIIGKNLSVNKLLNDEILIIGKYNNIIFEDYE